MARRQLTPGEEDKPIYVVWEVTLRCDHACSHCGSRAARARPDELDTGALLEIADQLIAQGTREVTLIGGEAYLRPDTPALVRHLTAGGIYVSMQTGGRAFTPPMAAQYAEAGLVQLGVSIDGPADVHDQVRGARGSHASAVAALAAGGAAGLLLTVNTQVNRLILGRIGPHLDHLAGLGVRGTRFQLTVPMGRAADHPDWLLQPWQVVEAIDEIAAWYRAHLAASEQPMAVNLSNNLGYYGPHEELLRSLPGDLSRYWGGCPAGRSVLSIESDGTIKPCPSLPTAPYASGNVRDRSIADAWADGATPIAFTRDDAPLAALHGYCKTCYYADTCRGGCSWTAHVTLGRPGDNPYCYHRVTDLRARGLRERLVQVERAAGIPYDFGRFELIREEV
jgi:radical SAM protein with 4Fe4S-binding SPASM domain